MVSRLHAAVKVTDKLLSRPWFGAGLALLSLSRFAWLGQDAPVLVHDNLDSNFVWLKVLAESGQIFAGNDAVIPNILGGIPRSGWDSELNVLVWLYSVFPPFGAYVANQVLIVFFAFVGMWSLIDRHLLPKPPGGPSSEAARGPAFTLPDGYRAVIINGTALCFAVLPFWPGGGLTIAGMPLVLSSVLSLGSYSEQPRGRWLVLGDVLAVLLFPLYSSLVCSFGLFFLLAIVWLWQLGERKLNWRLMIATTGLGVGHLVAEHRLVESMIWAGQGLSHRSEFIHKYATTSAAIKLVKTVLQSGQYHAASLHGNLLLPFVLVAALAGTWRSRAARLLWGALFAVAVAACVYGFIHWSGFESLYRQSSLLRSFNFGRLHWLHPLLWYSALALALAVVGERWFSRVSSLAGRRAGACLALLVVGGQLGFILQTRHLSRSIGGVELSYRGFYAPRLMNEIRDFIGAPQDSYRVASLGLDPSVAQYNGFYTVDGYSANYPLTYKQKFREIIAPELARDAKLATGYDNWGSRAYVFSRELSKSCAPLCTRQKHPKDVTSLTVSTEALYALGGRYLFSAVKIKQAGQLGLSFQKRFRDPEALWDVYLYSVQPHPESD